MRRTLVQGQPGQKGRPYWYFKIPTQERLVEWLKRYSTYLASVRHSITKKEKS
jgi:hypothetical protein